jgi:hypothetical protein
VEELTGLVPYDLEPPLRTLVPARDVDTTRLEIGPGCELIFQHFGDQDHWLLRLQMACDHIPHCPTCECDGHVVVLSPATAAAIAEFVRGLPR